MVQRKVSNKINIQPKNTLKTEKKHATTKPSLDNHDVKTKVADLKAIKMKKSRSIRRPDVEFGHRSLTKTRQGSYQPGEPPTLVTPTKTPSPKKPLCSHNSPNYMKSTNSSELHKVGKTLGKTSSLNKVRNLTKTPSFKHSKTLGSRAHKKVVLCENIDVKRATCSSTLKDYKFPSYLKLTPGATEAEGTSVMKVCPYNYCSLNGHHHTPAPPLKSFLSSRRRMLKTQKNVKPEVISPPSKRKGSEVKVTEDKKDDFFVEILVPRYDLDQVSEIDFQDDVDLSEMNLSSEENPNDEIPMFLAQNQGSSECCNNETDLEMDSDSSVSLDQNLGEVSDMEWEEGRILGFDYEKVEIPIQKDCGGDEIESGFELEKFVDGKLLPYIDDEIMEFLQFSDAETISDSESTQTDGEYNVEQIVDDETICTAKVEEGSFEGRDNSFSNSIEEVTKAQNEGLDSFEEHSKANGYESNEEIYRLEETTEGDTANIVMKETRSSDFSVEDIPWETINSDNADDINQAEVDQSEAGNTEEASLGKFDECQQSIDEDNLFSVEDVVASMIKANRDQNDAYNNIGPISPNYEEEHDSNEVKHDSIDNYVEEAKPLPTIRNDSINELLDCGSKFKRSVRCKNINDDNEEDGDFNPRPPNFLPVEPEPEAEKVDLRHQDVDERRNAQDWMLDHALQKTVNQLAPARKRKVALLVEAFEAVLPIPMYEPHMRRNLSVFSHARHIQACR